MDIKILIRQNRPICYKSINVQKQLKQFDAVDIINIMFIVLSVCSQVEGGPMCPLPMMHLTSP